jgi:hypothetical protein
MTDPTPEAELAALLRRAGYDLPPALLPDLAQGHALLATMLSRLGSVPADAEPATAFRPQAPR